MNVAWARQFGSAVELSSIIMLRQLSLLADHLPRCSAFAMVAFREPNGGDTRWPQEIHVVADIREPIYAAAVAACGGWHMRGGGCT